MNTPGPDAARRQVHRVAGMGGETPAPDEPSFRGLAAITDNWRGARWREAVFDPSRDSVDGRSREGLERTFRA